MTWRDELRRVRMTIDGRSVDLVGASFRGVPFLVEEVERSGGRRTVVHEFPLRDEPFIEDLGRRARKFPITGYVIGDDYLTAKNALLAALEDEEGPGQLLHPYYGVKSAICTTYSVRETSREGGIATFALALDETPAQAAAPVITPDGAGQVGAAADDALLKVQAELAEKYDAKGLPAFALSSAQTALTKASASLAARLGRIVAETQELANLNSQLTILTATAAALARAPAVAIQQFLAAIQGLTVTAESAPGALYDALQAAYNDTLGALVTATTATRIRELANQAAIAGALRRVEAIEAARLTPTIPFASIEDATAARDRIAAMLDEQAAGAGDTAYPALVELRAQVMRAVPGGQAFARVVTVTRRTSVPSLLLVYQLYGSVDQELDVIARNRVRHPGFIAGDLKVLSNG